MNTAVGAARAYATAPIARVQSHVPWGFPELFVISQTALPALLYLPGTQAVRLPIRISAFAISLAAFAWWSVESTVRPPTPRVQPWLIAVLSLLGVMILHPTTSSLFGGVAHVVLYFAVIAPLFWAPVFVKTPEHLARLLAIVLVCCGVNSLVGVLQVYDPARWMPAEFSRMLTESTLGLGPVSYEGPTGEIIVRPPGLFDTPGAVAGPAMFAALLGAVFGISAIAWWKRIGALFLSGAGIAAIYLSQVRVSLAVLVLMFGTYCGVLVLQRRMARSTAFGTAAAVMVVASLVVAFALGGDSVLERVMTLLVADPFSVYYQARGNQLDYTMSELMYQFPLGAGLGRWGMVGGYFGNPSLPELWAEIQITGWVIDGGIVLALLYCGALIVTARSELRLARLTQYPRLATCAGVVFAANIGIAVMIISFTPFVTQIGIQYWFLAGALNGVAWRSGIHDA